MHQGMKTPEMNFACAKVYRTQSVQDDVPIFSSLVPWVPGSLES